MHTHHHHSDRTRRHGLTLIELLAVVVLSIVLVWLLMPAGHHGREASRRVQCRNNLKQMGLALHNYHEQFKTFPPGYVANIDVRQADGRDGGGTGEPMGYALGWGWAAFILANVDNAPLLAELNASPLPDHGNATFRNGLPHSKAASDKTQTTILAYRCPSDNGSNVVATMPVMEDDGSLGLPCEGCYGRSNYIGVAGWFAWDRNLKNFTVAPKGSQAIGWKVRTDEGLQSPVIDPLDLSNPEDATYAPRYIYARHVPRELDGKAVVGRGVFGENSNITIRDLTDGTTNIIMVGERCTPSKNSTTSDIGNAIWAGVTHRGNTAGRASALGDTNLPLNHGNGSPSIRLERRNRPNTTGFMSLHDRGVHFLLTDGSVRLVSEDVELSTIRKLSMIDDGYPTGAPW